MAQLEVFYDGACHLCSKEINHYKVKDVHQRIDFVDITSPQFSASKYKLEGANFRKHMHGKTKDGKIVRGVAAFAEIWTVLEIFRPLQWCAKNGIIRPMMNLGYSLFAEVRPYLPRKESCETGCEI